MPTISDAAIVALAVGAGAAAVIDLRTRRIPNALTATIAAAGLTMAGTGLSGIPVSASFLGFLVGMLLMLPGHALGATGAGDVKLLAAIGAIVGPTRVVNAFLVTAVVGGVIALAIAVQRGRLAATVTGTGRLMTAPTGTRREIVEPGAGNRFCYGPAIAIGSVLAMWMW